MHRHLLHLENKGVGAHQSGQLPAWKIVLETLMTEGLLESVFATSTVAAGVDFPARSIVLLNSDRFNGSSFLPLSSTEFHQMAGRAGRRGMDNIGFAVVVPGKFMDIKLTAKLVNASPSDVISQIKIDFSMVLNLLLSHAPDQIELLLKKSFAAFLIKKNRTNPSEKKLTRYGEKFLEHDFIRHLNFLKENKYVKDNGELTDDGIWASKLRVDQPLMIAEGFRLKAFPESDPPLLAAIIAAFVNEREFDDNINADLLSSELVLYFMKVKSDLTPLAEHMIDKKFDVRRLFLRPALTIYNWALGKSWEEVLLISEIPEGNLAMLILRTADNLRHIRALSSAFPEAAQSAAKAIELIMREPVIMDY
jgi:superfamily II RNA helicase